MRTGPARQMRCGRTESVAAGTLDVDHLGAELGELGADEGLRDEHAGADHADAFERTEGGGDARRRRPLQALDPIRDCLPQRLDRVFVFDDPRIMSHRDRPPHAVSFLRENAHENDTIRRSATPTSKGASRSWPGLRRDWPCERHSPSYAALTPASPDVE